MLFTSLEFILFFLPVVMLVNFCCRRIYKIFGSLLPVCFLCMERSEICSGPAFVYHSQLFTITVQNITDLHCSVNLLNAVPILLILFR